MRGFLFLLPLAVSARLWAQTPTPATPAPKPAAARPAGASTTPKPAAKPAVKPPAPAPKPMTDDDKIIYSLGLSISRSLAQFDLSADELEIVRKALTDAAAGKPAVSIDEWGPKIQGLQSARAARVTERQKAASAAYLTKAAAEPGAQKTDSGLIYKELVAGMGESPNASDTVKVNYRGTLVDGTEFDSSYKRGQPAEFPLLNVIKCWTEGVQKMKPGGKAQLVCPAEIAYGEQGRPGIPGGATLVFEVELLEISGK